MKEKSSIPINQEEISHYLKDIRKIKVMTPERERELAEKMISNVLTDSERKEIQKELLEGNLRFVITVSKQYQNQGLDLCDLIAEGNLGLMKAIEHFDWTKRLRLMLNLPYTINLDNPLNEEGDTLLDILVNPNADLADKNLSTEDTLKEKLLNMLDVLDEREKVIIEDYFGLSGSTRTLEDIGTDFDLTKERVRQIKEKALRKLRNETGILFDYL